MPDDDIAFYQRRAREEAQAARDSASAGLASAHRLLALEYEALARDLRHGGNPSGRRGS